MSTANHWSNRFRPGDWIRHSGHGGQVFEYTLVSREQVTTPNGEKTLVTWRGTCAVCGNAFEFQARGHRGRLLRTCTEHRNAWTPPLPRKRHTPRRPKRGEASS
jgi:hypothetical protein